ncbi:MAG: glutathione transferase GstA [Corallincola sp.]|nr:glutathione transferase GstA [Corallincola sp.]
MKLYYAPGTCSLAVHIALREAALPFELVKVDLATHTTADGRDFYSIAPRGYVPLLELTDGSRYSEAAALMQYVADLQPDRPLIGEPGTIRRLTVSQWLAFVSTELHKTFSPLWRSDTPEATRNGAIARLNKAFAELDQLLGQQPWLAGEFSVADGYAFTVVNWAGYLKLPLDSYPQLQAYLGRVAARPAVQAALKAEGLA